MIFLKNLFKGVWVCYPIFNKLQYGARFAGEKLFETFENKKKTTPSPIPTVKKLVKFEKFFFVCDDIFLKKTAIPYPTIGKVW